MSFKCSGAFSFRVGGAMMDRFPCDFGFGFVYLYLCLYNNTTKTVFCYSEPSMIKKTNAVFKINNHNYIHHSYGLATRQLPLLMYYWYYAQSTLVLYTYEPLKSNWPLTWGLKPCHCLQVSKIIHRICIFFFNIPYMISMCLRVKLFVVYFFLNKNHCVICVFTMHCVRWVGQNCSHR